MRREIIDFYTDNKTPMEKLINIGVNRKGLTEASIIAAAEQLYGETQNGLHVPPVRIAWEVFSRARILKGHVEKKELDKTIELQNIHDDLKERYDTLREQSEVLQARFNTLHDNSHELAETIEVLQAKLAAAEKELEWYRQPWWKTRFRRPPNG
jgi:flagellar motility protein MotE (MotC chaperone)